MNNIFPEPSATETAESLNSEINQDPRNTVQAVLAG